MIKIVPLKPLKINRYTMITAIALSMAVAGWSIFKNPEDGAYNSGLPVETVVIEKKNGGTETFKLEVAAKPIDIEVGLMHRAAMPEDHGMIFLMGATPKVQTFWMKNTLIPLDMLFVGVDGNIAGIHENAEPLSLNPVSSVDPVVAVIELNGGVAKKRGIQPGDKVLGKRFH